MHSSMKLAINFHPPAELVSIFIAWILIFYIINTVRINYFFLIMMRVCLLSRHVSLSTSANQLLYQLGLIPERDVLFGTRLQQHRIALLFVNTDRVFSARQAETRDCVKIFSLALSRPFSQLMLFYFALYF